MAFSGISSAAGTFMVFLLGAFYQWRQVALYSSLVPMFTLFAVFFVKIDLFGIDLKKEILTSIFLPDTGNSNMALIEKSSDISGEGVVLVAWLGTSTSGFQ